MQLYATRSEHEANNAAFLNLMAKFPDFAASLFQPSPDKAPWHVQGVIDFGQYPILINFWPHKLKAQREGLVSVEGVNAIRGVIEGALEDAVSDEAFDVFE